MTTAAVRYVRLPQIRSTWEQDDGVLIQLTDRRYFTVSASGLALFEALGEPRSFAELVDVLTAKYVVTAEQAAGSVRAFLEQCRGADLVREAAGG